jgi:branched-chain amino acid transport system substrate-binding protein
MRLKYIFAAALIAVAAAVAAAAGTSGSATLPPIKFGIVAPAEGSPIINGEAGLAAVRAGVAALNKRGGLGGRKVELVYCNDKTDPNLAAACGRQLVDAKVAAEIGGVSIFGDALNAVLAANKIPQIGNTAFGAAELNAPNEYILGSTAPGYLVATGFAAAKGWKIALLGADNPTASGLYSLIEASAKQAGAEIVSKTLVPPTAPDLAPLTAAALSGKPDMILELLGQQQEQQFLAALAQTGNNTVRVMAASTVNPFLNAASGGDAIQNRRLSFSNFLPFSSKNAVIQQFKSELAAAYNRGKGDKWADLRQQGPTTISQWLGLWVIEQMVKNGQLKANNITPETITAALNKAKNLDMGGVTAPWTPNAAGPQGLSRISNPYYYVIGFRDGGRRQVLITAKPVTSEQALAKKFTFTGNNP